MSGLRPAASAACAVVHGSGKDQVSKGHFLIGDGIGDCIFWHGESVPRLLKIGGVELSGFVCCRLVTQKGLRAAVGHS